MARIFCVGRNYAAHAVGLGNALPTEPVIFMKPMTAIQDLSKEATAYIPRHLGQVHYEAELVLLLKDQKIEAITLGLDLTLREKQKQLKEKGLPWEASKAFDGSAVLGQFLNFTALDVKLEELHFTFKIDGEEVQHGHVTNQIFKADSVFEYISQWSKLADEDIIMTGTPEGVGELKPGQKVELELFDGKNKSLLHHIFEIKTR